MYSTPSFSTGTSTEGQELFVFVSSRIVPASASCASAGYQEAACESPTRNTSGASGFSPMRHPLGSVPGSSRWQPLS